MSSDLFHIRFSEAEGAGQFLQAQADEMNRLMQRLQSTSSELIGNGLGGYLAVQYGLQAEALFQTTIRLQNDASDHGSGLVRVAQAAREMDASAAIVFREAETGLNGFKGFSDRGGGGGANSETTVPTSGSSNLANILLLKGFDLYLLARNLPAGDSVAELVLKQIVQGMPRISPLVASGVGKTVGVGVVGSVLDMAATGEFSMDTIVPKLATGITTEALPLAGPVDLAYALTGAGGEAAMNFLADKITLGNPDMVTLFREQAQDLAESAKAASPGTFIEALYTQVQDVVTGQQSVGGALGDAGTAVVDWGKGMVQAQWELNSSLPMLLGANFGVPIMDHLMDAVGVNSATQQFLLDKSMSMLTATVSFDNPLSVLNYGIEELQNQYEYYVNP